MNAVTFGNWTGRLGMGLAERELQCVLGIAGGGTSKEIARGLGISPGTVDKRVLSASTKLSVTRRAQLVAAAFAQGIISLACAAPADPGDQHEQDHQGVFLA